MSLSDLEKIRLNRALLARLRLLMVDKDGPVLPPDGKYYYEESPHDRASVGSIAHRPSEEELTGGYPPAPNSIGLVFLAEPADDGRIELGVSGRFDVEHAYLPELTEMRAKLIRDPGGQARDKQDVPEAYRRYTVTFSDSAFAIHTNDLPSGVISPSPDTLTDALSRHRDHIAQDPRVYRRLVTGRGNKPKFVLDHWDEPDDQDAFNALVVAELFQPSEAPLPYDIRLELRVRRAPPTLVVTSERPLFLVELFLVNHTQREVAEWYRLYDHRVMDVEFEARITRGQHRPMRFALQPHEYRYEPLAEIDGYGHMCALERRAHNHLATNTFPTYEQPWIETPSAADIGLNAPLSFAALATDPVATAREILMAMDRYLAAWDGRIGAMRQAAHPGVSSAEQDRQRFADERALVERGVRLLEGDPVMLRAFRHMNETMGAAVEVQQKPFREWRLFQFVFILTQIAAIHERFDPALTEEAAEYGYADVLWFPTGGGKTEAYLGLIALAMFYQRLKGRTYGVSAWMRFPLRMLSVQQFQRLAYVVGQANRIKAREGIGGFPFTIGYYTGEGTPNYISNKSAYSVANYLPRLVEQPQWDTRLRFVNRCPYCNSDVAVQADIPRFRIKHVCTNNACWSHTSAPDGLEGEGIRGELGMFVSDEECYRYLPSVLVGTLDKLAVIGHNSAFQNFFGAVSHYCPDHGFITEGRCKHRVVTRTQAGWSEPVQCPNSTRSEPHQTLRLPGLVDPGFPLLINDELHLLREDLGNFDAHYETLLAHVQRGWPGGRPPKLLAATATIRDYEHHVHHLYLRRARRFPSPGVDRDTSFYTRIRKDPQTGSLLVRRTYVGMIPVGTGIGMAERVAGDANERYQELIDEVVEVLQTHPENEATALGFAPDRARDLEQHITTHQRLSLVYATRMVTADYINRRFDEANQARREHGLSERAYERLDGQTPLGKIQDVIERIERNVSDDPCHEVVATSVVSHGVDLERLNMEFFGAWPPSTAEYLQASSRSGRVHPGIILVALSYAKLFEATVFAHFVAYHSFIERLVESVPINRFAPNVLERTLPGIVHALLLNWARRQPWGGAIRREARTVRDALNQPGTFDQLVAETVAALRFEDAERIGVFDPSVLQQARGQAHAEAERLIGKLRGLPARYYKDAVPEVLRRLYGHGPMTSLRDIENPVSVEPSGNVERMVLEALAR